ncbi:MAG: zinc-binding dehydrogenase [Armatimonadota bacterium]
MSLPTKGRAVQIVEPGRFEIVEIPVPEPAPDEVLIEVEACSTCTNWELCMWEGRDIFARPGHPRYPLNPGAPGHEAAGHVVARGAEVREVCEGDLVAVKPSLRGHENDTHATHIVRPESEVAMVGSHVSAEEAAVLEMAMCALRSVELAEEHWRTTGVGREDGGLEGAACVIVGLGPAGILHVQAARLAGATAVVGIDTLESRRLQAKPFADAVFAPEDEALGGFLAPHDRRIVIECSGNAAAMALAVALARGAVHVFGVPEGRWVYDQSAWSSGAAILPYHWRGRPQAPLLKRAAQLLSEGKLDTACLISAVLPYERYAEGLEKLKRREALKIIFRWE